MIEPLLCVKNLHAEIEGKAILNGINLEVKAGEIHAIMGPNGAGKSTLSSVITGHDGYDITQGELIFEGKDISEDTPEERAHKGVFMSFQYPIEIPGITVNNFLRVAVNENRKARGQKALSTTELLNRIKSVAQLLNVDMSFLSRYLNQGFSGGEKKRNEILQMLMLEPKLAILDETDSGLDIDALKLVAEGVHAFKSDENGIVLITHYQRLLNYIKPDYIHVLSKGKIVKTGDASLALELEKKGYDWLS